MISLDPVNRDAARILSGGEQYEDRAKDVQAHLRMHVAAALQARCTRPPWPTTNYAGQRRGRITVLYWSHTGKRPRGDRKHYWLIRCDCGEFEFRVHWSLAKNRTVDMCEKCKRLDYLRSL